MSTPKPCSSDLEALRGPREEQRPHEPWPSSLLLAVLLPHASRHRGQHKSQTHACATKNTIAQSKPARLEPCE